MKSELVVNNKSFDISVNISQMALGRLIKKQNIFKRMFTSLLNRSSDLGRENVVELIVDKKDVKYFDIWQHYPLATIKQDCHIVVEPHFKYRYSGVWPSTVLQNGTVHLEFDNMKRITGAK